MNQNRCTNLLLAANLLVFLAEIQLGDGFVRAFALWPAGAGFEPWQLLTNAFLHAGAGHLATNLLGLWMFGRPVEQALGARRLLVLYFGSLLTASIGQLAAVAATGGTEPSLGASGAVFGLLAAFGLMFPKRIVVLLIPPIPLPAWLFVSLYGLFELYAGVSGSEPGIAHFAHLGGLFAGIVLIRHWHHRDAGLRWEPRAY